MTTTTFAYRDDAEGAAIRLSELVTRRARDDRALADALRAHGRRAGRIAAGVTGLGAAMVMAVMAGAFYLTGAGFERGTLTAILLGAWPAMGLAYVAGRVIASRRSGEPAVPTRARDLHAEIARLEQEVPLEDVRIRAELGERASVAMPLIALALLAPLTLHAIAFALMGGAASHFDGWIALSLAIVGHAHLVLAWVGHRFAREAATSTSDELRVRWSAHAWKAYGYTVLASAIPGAVFILIPPALTAVTGLFVVPLAFRTVTQAILTERRLLGAEA